MKIVIGVSIISKENPYERLYFSENRLLDKCSKIVQHQIRFILFLIELIGTQQFQMIANPSVLWYSVKL